jgi:plastocyanin
MRPTVLSACAGTVIVLAAAACGGGGGSGGATTESEATTSSSGSGGGGTPVKTIRIVEKEYSLSPSSVSISKPGLYVIQGVNQGSISHGIAIEGNGIDMDGPIVSPGETSTVRATVSKQGSYELYCPVGNHKEMGMEGHLTLGSGGGSGTSTEDDHTSTGTSTGSGGYGYG